MNLSHASRFAPITMFNLFFISHSGRGHQLVGLIDVKPQTTRCVLAQALLCRRTSYRFRILCAASLEPSKANEIRFLVGGFIHSPQEGIPMLALT